MIFVLSAFFRPLWDEDLTWVCWCCKKKLFWFFNSPTASILILRTHNPVTTKGDHQWVLQRLFLVEPSSLLAISELFPFSFCLFIPSTASSKGYDWLEEIRQFDSRLKYLFRLHSLYWGAPMVNPFTGYLLVEFSLLLPILLAAFEDSNGISFGTTPS